MTSDGQLLQVKVTKVTESTVSFNYPGESVINEIKSDGIDKIVFASGRTQNFNGSSANSSVVSNEAGGEDISMHPDEPEVVVPTYEENTMAIIPIKFTRNGKYDKTLSNNATDYVAGLMSKSADQKEVKILEKGKAIEKLIDAGVNYERLRQSSPEELRNVLGTEYLLYTDIDEREKDQTAGPDGGDDAGSPGSNEHRLLERAIGLRVYGADSEVEALEIDFSENIFKGNVGDGDPSLLADGKWKSSLRYLTDRLLASTIFTD